MSTPKLSTIILPHDRWPEIERIERDAFNDIMPATPRQTTFLAAVDGNEIAAHLRVEHLYHLVHVHVALERRNHATLAKQLMTEAAECIPEGFSGVWLTRKPVPDKLVRMFGAEPKGQFWLYRRDN